MTTPTLFKVPLGKSVTIRLLDPPPEHYIMPLADMHFLKPTEQDCPLCKQEREQNPDYASW